MGEISPDAQFRSIGEMSTRSGVSISAIRYYEELGLILSWRTEGNQRRFDRSTLRKIAFIRASQRVGISISAIKDALSSLPHTKSPTREDWTKMSLVWRKDLDERIRRLKELRDRLTHCIGCGCLSIDRCALANPKDVLAKTGAGPRRYLD